MAEIVIPDDLLKLLRSVDTPTVCNAIEVAQGRRGFNRFTRGTMQHSKPGDPAIVGRARTAKIAGLRPSKDPIEAVKERRLKYFRSMAEGDGPTAAVIEDIDYPTKCYRPLLKYPTYLIASSFSLLVFDDAVLHSLLTLL